MPPTEEALSILKESIPEDSALFFWHSPRTRWHRFCGLPHVYLVVMFRDSEGAHAIRVPGTVTRDECGTQKILYAREGVVRIKNGPRVNMVVTPERLRPDEQASFAGLDKTLSEDLAPGCFFPELRPGDRIFLDMLWQGFVKTTVAPMDIIVYPQFYTKSNIPPPRLRPRLNGTVNARLMAERGYRKDLSFDKNFDNLKDRFYVKSDEFEKNIALFPFAMAEAPGGVFADMDQLPGSCRVPAEALVASDFVFKVTIERKFL